MLSITDARRLAILGQLLAGDRAETPLEVVERLGKVQIDPTATVARAERLVLWSRLGAYDVDGLRVLLEETRELFEFLAFLIPAADLALHRPAMLRYPRHLYARGRYVGEWLEANASFHAYVLDELRSRGPLRSRDLDDRAEVPWRTGGWNDGKNLGRMLEILWHAGEIAISRREGTERVWDLFERVLPDVAPLPDEVAAIELMERQLRARGFANAKFGTAIDYELPAREVALESLLADGVAVPVAIDDLPGEWLVHRDLLAALEDPWRPRTTLLCPFDQLIYDRARTAALFNFRYRLEIYQPAAKREYGYYVLPILHGDHLIGRIDPVLDRKSKVLTVNAVYAEPRAPADAWPAVKAAIDDLASWIGAEEIVLPPLPAPWR